MGLEREVVERPYPKKCACGMCFEDRISYVLNTTIPISGVEYGEIKGVVIEFRNCGKCLSTLCVEIVDLRDYSPEGMARRQKFLREKADLQSL